MKRKLLILISIIAWSIMIFQPLRFNLIFIVALFLFPIGFMLGRISKASSKVKFTNDMIGYLHNGSTLTAKIKEKDTCYLCGQVSDEIFYTRYMGNSLQPFCPKCTQRVMKGLKVVRYDEKQRRIS